MKRENILTKKIAKSLSEAAKALDFKEAYDYIEEELKETDKPILLEFCTWCYEKNKLNEATIEILWQEWIKETTVEEKFKVVKTKILKSTTSVEGTLIQVTGGKWYAVTRLMPPRSPWYTRACIATPSGRLSMERKDMVFMKSHVGKPSVEEAVELLMSILNGAEPILDIPTYN